MNNWSITKPVVLLIAAALVTACSEKPLEAPSPPAYVKPTPDNWTEYQDSRTREKGQYIQ